MLFTKVIWDKTYFQVCSPIHDTLNDNLMVPSDHFSLLYETFMLQGNVVNFPYFCIIHASLETFTMLKCELTKGKNKKTWSYFSSSSVLTLILTDAALIYSILMAALEDASLSLGNVCTRSNELARLSG